VATPWGTDDDELLTALRGAVRGAAAVPREFVEAGKAAYAWHSIDADLAALTYDSALDQREMTATRAEQAPLRALTFASEAVTIELEVADGAICGQVVPPRPGEVEVRPLNGQPVTAAIDDVGYFVLRPIPPGTFRLWCRLGGGVHVLTGWIRP
jgi:hypothetical protein